MPYDELSCLQITCEECDHWKNNQCDQELEDGEGSEQKEGSIPAEHSERCDDTNGNN